MTTRGWTNYNFIGRKTDYNTNHQGMGGYAIHDFVIPPAEMRVGFTENPFYNPNTQLLDFNYYMTNNSFTGDIDYLILEHGVNDLLTYNRTPEQIVADLKIFIDQLHINYPNCKVLLCGLVHPSPLNDFYDAYLQSERIHPINKAYDGFAADALYSGFVTYVPVCVGFDADYGYQFTTAPAYRNSTEQVKVLSDYLHPNEAGYCMEADQVKAAFLAII